MRIERKKKRKKEIKTKKHYLIIDGPQVFCQMRVSLA